MAKEIAFCVKCRKKVQMKNPKEVTLKNNRTAVKGICNICGTTVYKFGKLSSSRIKTKILKKG